MRIALVFTLLAVVALTACGEKNVAAPTVAAVSPPAGKQWTEVVVQTPEGYRMGNPDAAIKLVEYGSRICPYCGAFGREGAPLMEAKYVKAGKVSYEFREFLVHGAPDVPFAKLGLCVGTEAFFPVLDQMFLNQAGFEERQSAAVADKAFVASLQTMSPTQQATAWGERLGTIDFMKQHGMPEEQVHACLNDTKGLEKLAKTTSDLLDSRQVTSTPTFIINGQKVDESVFTWAQLEPFIKNAGG